MSETAASLVAIVILGFAGIGMVEFGYWVQSRVRAVTRPIRLGQLWEVDHDDPFAEVTHVRVTGYAKGYVRYEHRFGFRKGSQKASEFRKIFRPSEDTAREEGG